MHLIAPLVSGIANAGGGSAKITRRGTTTLAALYSSFEGDAFASSSVDSNSRVILDAYGRAEVYVNEVCDVAVYDSEGQLQISFTAGYSAAAIEVRSPAFTGQAYDYSTGRATSQPTSLQAVLDLWYTAHAEADWEWANSLPFIVVTDDAYGAVGDATTDDTAAINAALAAAPYGGVLFFPSGTYKVTSAIAIPGSAPYTFASHNREGRLEIQSAAATLFSLEANSKLTVIEMALDARQEGSGPLIDIDLAVSNEATLTLTDCVVGGEHCAHHLIENTEGAHILIEGCEFYIAAASASALYASSGNFNDCRIADSYFTAISEGYSGAGYLYGNPMHVRGCEFDASEPLTGSVIYIKLSSTSCEGSVTECVFREAANAVTSAVAIDLGTLTATAQFVEYGNIFPNGLDYSTPSFRAYAYTPHKDGHGLLLLTRETRSIRMVDNANSVNIPTDQYGLVVLSSTHAHSNLRGALAPNGAKGTIVVYHPSGGAGDSQLTDNFFNPSLATTANTSSHAWTYICTTVNATLRLMLLVDARALGNGA